ncbi:hypothetical protein DFH07DRAFT_946445 [Mycena maculata]|uniref:Uncharacterized protein n=1 Tax=Mycena maculata TaxID=230809 RepID=A0AAD7HMH6_9AGAR|nr:hypothetical protein DFH07DRAFT_946445 [Mycena maculata]
MHSLCRLAVVFVNVLPVQVLDTSRLGAPAAPKCEVLWAVPPAANNVVEYGIMPYLQGVPTPMQTMDMRSRFQGSNTGLRYMVIFVAHPQQVPHTNDLPALQRMRSGNEDNDRKNKGKSYKAGNFPERKPGAQEMQEAEVLSARFVSVGTWTGEDGNRSDTGASHQSRAVRGIREERERNERLLCVCVCGGSGRPGRLGLRDAAGKQRGSPGRGKVGRGDRRGRPNPYAEATEGQEERDSEQPSVSKERGMGGWSRKAGVYVEEKSTKSFEDEGIDVQS